MRIEHEGVFVERIEWTLQPNWIVICFAFFIVQLTLALSYIAILLDLVRLIQYSSTVYFYAYYLPDPLFCKHCSDGPLVRGYEDYGNGIAGWMVQQVVGLLSLFSNLNVTIYENRVEDNALNHAIITDKIS